MRITLLLAGCMTSYLQNTISTVVKVLEELEVEIQKVDLQRLPYFTGANNRVMEEIMQSVQSSQGVIGICSVPMLSMHGAMQSFFDTATLYSGEAFDKPMLAITYSEWLGESEAAGRMLKSWNILGGIEGNKICLNKEIAFREIEGRLEREIEDFYRLIKQARKNIGSSERLFYRFVKSGQTMAVPNTETLKQEKTNPEIKSFVDLLKTETMSQKVTHQKVTSQETVKQPSINLSTKEQTIKEISNLLKKEVSEDGFTSMSSGIYGRPRQTEPMKVKRLAQLPHYFIAQHDTSLCLNLKYCITDSGEEGGIIIKHGDCEYVPQLQETPTVELMLTEEVLSEIQSKKMTYQKAFMLGKLKVKGNFSILPKLDQIFKAI